MVSLQGRFLNWYLTCIGFKHGMGKDIEQGNNRAAVPSAKIMKRNSAQAKDFEGRKVWYFHPRSGRLDAPKEIVIFLHGGAYFYDILKEHFPPWAKIADLSGELVVLPSYPLTPQASAKEITDFAYRCFLDIQSRYPEAKIILGGDSAGGGLALQVTQRLIAEGEGLPVHMILWSPWVDVSRDNPALEAQDARSVIIGIKGALTAAELYQGDLDAKDPAISPIYGELAALPPMSLVTGSRDLLHPDIMRFDAAAKSAGASLDTQIWEEQNHYFMYLPQPEASKVHRQTAQLIQSI